MKAFSATAVGITLLLAGQVSDVVLPMETALSSDIVEAPVRTPASQNEIIQGYVSDDISIPSVLPVDLSPEELTGVVQKYCVVCHNDVMLTGNLTLSEFDVGSATVKPVIAEKMIVKLRAGMMPIPGAPRPSPDTLLALVETLETIIDDAAAEDPNPGSRTFQRLNRAEYAQSIKDLLDLDIDAGDYLPLDTKSANFDNIADVQMLSPTLLGGYLSAAGEISRLAVGDPDVTASEATYRVSRWASQREHIEGAPRGTRGGISVAHNFPADGHYRFRVSFHHETTGALYGSGADALHTAEQPEQLEISIEGQRVALLELGRWMHASHEDGVNLRTDPIAISAGPKRVSAAFIQRFEGPLQDLLSPHDWSLASTSISNTYGFQNVPHLRDFAITGPDNVSGISETPSRKRIFTCRPSAPEAARDCAKAILSELGSRAFREPLAQQELDGLMSFYEMGGEEGGFEGGIRNALEAILASPYFVFRFEEQPEGLKAGENYQIADIEMASRLSFFLWGTPPDEELRELALENRLSDPDVLESQVDRMLSDPRSEALSRRFAAQWLRLSDLLKINPDVRLHPDFDEPLKQSMLEETQLLFNSLVQEDRSVLELFTADYTYVNERLAKHYGIQGITGNDFQKVQYPSERRRGILGQGSVLTLTSHAGRTSPVLRGKWVMEVLLGTPPPPPPPGVPDLDETELTSGGRMLTTRERMEMHRSNPVCNSCHSFMDPIGLSLDNFDVTGRWRIKENGVALDTQGELYDGTPVASPDDLLEALMKRPIPLIRNFTENLMAYALGRRVEYYDKPTVRAITKQAEAEGYRMSSFVMGVINSPAFQMSRAEVTAEDQSGSN